MLYLGTLSWLTGKRSGAALVASELDVVVVALVWSGSREVFIIEWAEFFLLP